jgi:ParB-like chromosome segregation protein Spo0J
MTEAKLETLADDIRAHGLREPIILYHGGILDGRNRYRACVVGGVEPTFKDFEGTDEEVEALVLSLNLHRRDLTTGQRALMAAEKFGLEEKRTGPIASNGSNFDRSTRSLAKKYNVAQRDIIAARDYLRDALDLADSIKNRSMSMLAASQKYEERQREAKEEARTAERVQKYAEAIALDGTQAELPFWKRYDSNVNPVYIWTPARPSVTSRTRPKKRRRKRRRRLSKLPR